MSVSESSGTSTDLMELVPRARRAMEGPFGPPPGRPALADEQIYPMVADATADIILFSGSLFEHELVVTARDPTANFPTAWEVTPAMNEWDVSLITTEVALNYYFFLLRDLKTTETIQNEGTQWSYTVSANVMRDYLTALRAQRDTALAGMRSWHQPLDRYASIIRVRDQATVALLEWWDTNIADRVPGLPGGQEAAVIPWTPGWSGPGWGP
jgi:hypothetical protein